MPDNHYINPKLAELYDLDSPWSKDRDFYLNLANREGMKILDLGCGTGLLCNAYAKDGHAVTGVDPSGAMLNVARQKEHGDKIDWVQAFSQEYRSTKQFDLIIMTGHAFQVLIEDKDIATTFATMKEHLAKDGSIVFESRNPVIEWQNSWDYDMEIELQDYTVQESRRFKKWEGDRMTFELIYRFPDDELISTSELRFSNQIEIQDLLTASGLHIESVYGDWEKTPFDETISEEMIFVVKSEST